MGNFYDMIATMKNGDMIQSVSHGYTIKKIDGVLKYLNNGEVAKGLGKDGFVFALDNMNTITWEKVPNFEYVQVTDLNEVRGMLSNGEKLYIDHYKEEIDAFTDLREANCIDFEDVLMNTDFFKKVAK